MGQDFLDKQYVLCGQYVKVDNLIDPQGPGVGAHQLFPQFDDTFLIVGILAVINIVLIGIFIPD